jgi:hypothetical protein
MIKTEFPGYMKDDTPGQARAILNTDAVSLNAYREARSKDRALKNVVEEVGNLKQDMNDIKAMLMKLINGNNNG